PVLLLELVMVWAWLRWRQAREAGQGAERLHRRRALAPTRRPTTSNRWFLLIGACAGWAAITRPVDAVALALTVMTAIAIDLYRTTSGAARLRAAALVAAAALPFFAVQA